MANVLPFEEKKRLSRRMFARFIFVLSLTLILGAVIASLALLPAILQVRIAQEALTSPENEVARTARDDQAKGARAQILMDALSPIVLATSTPATEALDAALALKPASVSISNISYGPGSIQLSGVSNNRQAVNAFRDALEKDSHFKTVAVPVAALVGTQDGRFTMTLTGNY